jgi:hypothetical protein
MITYFFAENWQKIAENCPIGPAKFWLYVGTYSMYLVIRITALQNLIFYRVVWRLNFLA